MTYNEGISEIYRLETVSKDEGVDLHFNEFSIVINFDFTGLGGGSGDPW